jgi:hypothetical protein
VSVGFTKKNHGMFLYLPFNLAINVAAIHCKESKIHSVCRQCCFFSNMYSTVLHGVHFYSVQRRKILECTFSLRGCPVHCTYIAVCIFVAVLWGVMRAGECVYSKPGQMCVLTTMGTLIYMVICVNYIPC